VIEESPNIGETGGAEKVMKKYEQRKIFQPNKGGLFGEP
jgi:hypothetical protein